VVTPVPNGTFLAGITRARVIALLRRGLPAEVIQRTTGIAPWFVSELDRLVGLERRLRVAGRSMDDELLVGLTLNYGAAAVGFFVTPCDPKSNNERIFVINRAVRHVRFL